MIADRSPDDGSEEWALVAHDNDAFVPRAQRPLPVGGLMGYLDPLSVRPGAKLGIHLNAPAAHTISIARLGRKALLGGSPDDAADRADAEVVTQVQRDTSSRYDIRPGSWAQVGGPALDRPTTISAWVRLWRLPVVPSAWNYVAVVSDYDYPGNCNWLLGFTDDGRPACYVGSGAHDRIGWTFGGASVAGRFGEWVHLACVVDGSGVTLYLDGVATGQGTIAVGGKADAAGGTARIGACAEGGIVDHLLDADVSDVRLYSRALKRLEVVALTENRTLHAPTEPDGDSIVAHWPLREMSGPTLVDVTGSGRDANAVNKPTYAIPGPPASTAVGRAGYEPGADPLRGGSVRFASDDLVDCEWPAAAELTVPDDADSGTYYVRVQLTGSPDEEALEMPFVVARTTPRRPRSVAVLFSTFTWTAYARRPWYDGGNLSALTSSCYSNKLSGRMFYHVGMRLPMFRAQPFAHRTHVRAETNHQHIVRPERFAEAWLEAEGYSFECLTDVELTMEPELLDRFEALMIVGHSEYWSQEMRDGIESYLQRGGKVACLSGNTALWRVGYDDTTRSMECRKTSQPGEGVGWLTPDEWGERWHEDGAPGGKFLQKGEAPYKILGLETMGWVDVGDKDSYAPFTVRDPEHFLFHTPEEVPFEQDGKFATTSHDGPAISGCEPDGLPDAQGLPALPSEGLAWLAHAQHRPNDYCAQWADDPLYGSDLIYWERPNGGIVFNGANTNYTGVLVADPGIAALTRNVLHHFGVDKA